MRETGGNPKAAALSHGQVRALHLSVSNRIFSSVRKIHFHVKERQFSDYDRYVTTSFSGLVFGRKCICTTPICCEICPAIKQPCVSRHWRRHHIKIRLDD